MKSTRLILCSFAVGAVLPATGLFAQTPAPTATPSVSAPAATANADAAEEKEATKEQRAAYNTLTPEEQGKLRAARKAARKDPAVMAAQADRKSNPRAFRDAIQAAMIKSDPSVGQILEKMKASRRAERRAKKQAQ